MMNKVFIVTASSGIGAETIRLLLKAGSKVFYIGRDINQCNLLLNEIKESGFVADYINGDLTEEGTAKRLVDTCIEKYGRIDGLFNVAGISGRRFGDAALHECSLEGWNTVINTNLTTQFQMSKFVIQQMLQQEPDENGMRGVILNMSSVLAFSPEANNFTAIAYAASKGAIISMTKNAAAFYAKNKIRINAIAPGLAQTKMSARASQDDNIVSFIKTKQPLASNVMMVDDVAKSAYFLLSNNSLMITGETLVVDAGWSIT